MRHDLRMGAPPACDIPAWMVRALAGEGVIEVHQRRATVATTVVACAGATYAVHQGLTRPGNGVGTAGWLVTAALLVGAALRLVVALVAREPTWTVGADGVTTSGWLPRRRWRVGAATEASWRWDEEAWRFRPVPRSPELRVRERQLRFVPAHRAAHAS
jgi:hypothetical protein